MGAGASPRSRHPPFLPRERRDRGCSGPIVLMQRKSQNILPSAVVNFARNRSNLVLSTSGSFGFCWRFFFSMPDFLGCLPLSVCPCVPLGVGIGAALAKSVSCYMRLLLDVSRGETCPHRGCCGQSRFRGAFLRCSPSPHHPQLRWCNMYPRLAYTSVCSVSACMSPGGCVP